jgi:hypothetical protein
MKICPEKPEALCPLAGLPITPPQILIKLEHPATPFPPPLPPSLHGGETSGRWFPHHAPSDE